MTKAVSGAVALDAMGGDHAPAATVQGAVEAVRQHGLEVLLVGREAALRRHLSHLGGAPRGLRLVDAPEVVAMDDAPTAPVRAKRNSSMAEACRLVRDGEACAFVTAGNSGAAMVAAKLIIGTIAGVERPALAAPVPGLERQTLVIDVGANVDCKPHNLEQFAIMGEIYYRTIFGTERPSVGLLSIGEEEAKGNDLTRETYPLLKRLPLNFVGNVEGRDLYNGRIDVIVCDGFVGNVALKISEGLVEAVRYLLRDSLTSTITAQVGALLARKAFTDFGRKLDYSEYGGAPLLGIKGVAIVGHGRSNANAIKNAVRVAKQFYESGVNAHIEKELTARGDAAPAGVAREENA